MLTPLPGHSLSQEDCHPHRSAPRPLPQRELPWANGSHICPFLPPTALSQHSRGPGMPGGCGSVGLALAAPASTTACHFLQGQGLLLCVPSVLGAPSEQLRRTQLILTDYSGPRPQGDLGPRQVPLAPASESARCPRRSHSPDWPELPSTLAWTSAVTAASRIVLLLCSHPTAYAHSAPKSH